MQVSCSCRKWHSSVIPWALVAVLAAALAGCKQRPAHKTTPPAHEAAPKPAATSQPTAAATSPATTQPTSQPASKPASRPASTYSSKPPYPVNLYVLSPKEEQPGWLRILKLGDDQAPATCGGVFPEHNVIDVQTSNVRQLRLHIGYLPLTDRKRIVLHIDHQAMELAHKHRAFIILERAATGQWRIERSED